MNTANNSSKDFLLLGNINMYVLPFFSLYNCDINMIKFKDTEKQRAVFKIDTFDKSYCLKKVYYSEAELLFVYSAMEWAYRNGISVPKLLPSNDGNRYVIYNGMIFILSDWVGGDKCDFDNPLHITLSAKTLSKLHKSSIDFKPISGSSNRSYLQNFNLSLVRHFNTLLDSANSAESTKDKFSKIYLKNFDYNLSLAKIALEISSDIKNDDLSTSLCHGDYVNKNILIEDNKNVNLIDFDKCAYDYSAHDIAYFLRRFLKRPTTNWNIDSTLSFLDTYSQLHPLSSADYKYILAYLAFPQKYWKVSRDYYKNIKKCNKNYFITILEKSLERTARQREFILEMQKILNL